MMTMRTLMNKKKIQLMPTQWKFITCKSRKSMMVTGRGYGKSVAVAYKVIQLLAEHKSMLVCAPNFRQLKQSIFKAIIKALNDNRIQYKYNKSEMTIECNGETIYGFSGESFESARGLTNVTALIVDEAALIKEEAIKVWAACLRGQGKPEMYFVSTPRGTQNWLYKYSLKPDFEVFHAKSRDNFKVADEFHDDTESIYGDSQFTSQELEGLFVDFNGGFYEADNINVIDPNKFTINPKQFCIAFDLAYTEKKKSDYSAAVLCCMTVEGYFVVLDVQRWKKKISNTESIVRNFINKYRQYGAMPAFIEANGTQVAIYDAFRKAGINVSKAKFSHIAKSERMFSHAIDVGAGKVYINDGIELKDEIVGEYRNFATDDSHDHDDMIDAINYCALHFNGGILKKINLKK